MEEAQRHGNPQPSKELDAILVELGTRDDMTVTGGLKSAVQRRVEQRDQNTYPDQSDTI